MQIINRMVNGEKISIESPMVEEILADDFDYGEFTEGYLRDKLLARKDIFQGYFALCADEDLSEFYDNHTDYAPLSDEEKEADLEYGRIINDLQQVYEKAYRNNVAYKVNLQVTEAMKIATLSHLERLEKIKHKGSR